MATLKRCDGCHETWGEEEHRQRGYGDERGDAMLCIVSIVIPSYTSHNYNWDKVSEYHELCQRCAREVVELIKSKHA